VLGAPGEWHFRGVRGTRLKDGETVLEVTVPANGEREVTWQVQNGGSVNPATTTTGFSRRNR